jgi:Holliday junction resolvase RusA-like endonuclease
MPKPYTDHVKALGWTFKAALPKGYQPAEGSRYFVKVIAYMGNARRVDVDNLEKTVLDAANDVVWCDDSDVETVSITKLVDRDRPRVEVRVWVRQAQGVLV